MTTTIAGRGPAGQPRTAPDPVPGASVHPEGDRATAPGRDVLQARYRAATTAPAEYADSLGISLDNSRDWYRVERILRRWAAITAGGELYREADMESLEQLVEGIFAEAERRITEWAEGIGR